MNMLAAAFPVEWIYALGIILLLVSAVLYDIHDSTQSHPPRDRRLSGGLHQAGVPVRLTPAPPTLSAGATQLKPSGSDASPAV